MPTPVTTGQREFTPPAVDQAYQELLGSLPTAEAPLEAWVRAFERWDALKRWIDGSLARGRYREAQDTRDEAVREAVRIAREQIEPLLKPYEFKLRVAFLAAKCRAGLEERFGARVFVRFALAQSAYEPANVPLLTRESQEGTDYMRLLGTAELSIEGETVNMVTALARLSEPDAAGRRKAWDAVDGWLSANAQQIHGHYDELIKLRHEMAINLGDDNYIAQGYRRMGRTDYGPAEVATFREEIRTHVVPVMQKLRAWQARMLETPAVAPWDTEFYPGLSLPPGVVPIDQQLTRLQALFDRLDPRMAAHARTMIARDLIDLPSRPGKGTGGFCTSYEDTGEALIFCNSTGNANDVTILTHEMGHALQVWESMALPAVDLHWPDMDAAEVHSMGLELLALPHIDAFFPNGEAAQYRRLLFVTVLNRLPYMAVVDAFQHWVYAHPTHTHAEREAHWNELWDEYLPGIDASEVAVPQRTRWMRQAHLFKNPFYYIDYALAECGALQLWQLAEQDHAKAMESYMHLCRLGGTLPLVAFFKEAGLESPFTPGVLGPLMAKVLEQLELT